MQRRNNWCFPYTTGSFTKRATHTICAAPPASASATVFSTTGAVCPSCSFAAAASGQATAAFERHQATAAFERHQATAAAKPSTFSRCAL